MNPRTPSRAALLLLAGWLPAAQAADLDNGRQLYEAHCTRCHSEEVFLRHDRLVNTEQQLVERIRQCELSNELAWFEEEVADVAAYLATEFYQFDQK